MHQNIAGGGDAFPHLPPPWIHPWTPVKTISTAKTHSKNTPRSLRGTLRSFLTRLKIFFLTSYLILVFIYIFCLDDDETPCWAKPFKIFCGLDRSQNSQQSSPVTITDISEKRGPATIVNVFGVLMLCTMMFLFGYYA